MLFTWEWTRCVYVTLTGRGSTDDHLYIGYRVSYCVEQFRFQFTLTYNDMSNQQDATNFSFINLFKSAQHF